MDKGLVANASIVINAPLGAVWDALVTPEAIKQYMFGTTVVSDCKEGSPIRWNGEWQGTAPANYHTVTIELSGEDSHTAVSLRRTTTRRSKPASIPRRTGE